MSVNKVILIGNLGKDPEVRYTPAGVAVCSFSLATSEKYKNKQGESQEQTEWHNCVVWQQLAEICGKYLKKGSKVFIEGKISNRSYDDRDGNKKYISEIVVKEMRMLDAAPSNGGQQRSSGNSGSGQQSSRPQQQANDYDSQEPPFNPDDDIPF